MRGGGGVDDVARLTKLAVHTYNEPALCGLIFGPFIAFCCTIFYSFHDAQLALVETLFDGLVA
jgi:hypothetical protein